MVNLFGGPGCGKSTAAAYIFSQLKMRGHTVELVNEYAKRLTWEENYTALKNQVYILGQQYYQECLSFDKVSCVITDSPLLIGTMYRGEMDIDIYNDYKNLAVRLFQSRDNFNIMMKREGEYDIVGRNQTLEQAEDLDNVARGLVEEYCDDYVTCGENDIENIINQIELKIISV